MYSDIVPPPRRKSNSIRNISLERLDQPDPGAEKTYLPRSSSGNRKVPRFFLFLIISILLIGAVLYARFIEHTTITFTPQPTTLEIRERIPLTLQKDNATGTVDVLQYSLIYISAKNTTRNPFAPMPQTPAPASSSIPKLTAREIVATSTGATTSVYFVNESKEKVPLRATTRVDVKGVTYSLANSLTIDVTSNASSFANREKYYLPGFKGTSLEKMIYAVPVSGGATVVTTNEPAPVDTPTTAVGSTTALVPTDVISLLPDTSVGLKKNTIYDSLLDQPAVVVFDKKDLLNELQKKNPGTAEYVSAFLAIEDMIAYTVDIVDYELEVSAESGRPIAFKRIVLEITPVLDTEKAKTVFPGYSTDTMEKIAGEISKYATLKTRTTPFWSKEVAAEGKVEVRVESK